MLRKINKVGKGTLTVSLPAGWAKANGLRPGATVEVMEADGALGISCNKPREDLRLRLREGEDLLRRTLVAAYIRGFAGINVSTARPIRRDVICDIMKKLPGFNILSFSPHKLRIKDSTAPEPDQFGQASRDLWEAVSSMFSQLKDELRKAEPRPIPELAEVRETIQRLSFYSQRALFAGQVPRLSLVQGFFIARHLREIGNDLQEINGEIASVETSHSFKRIFRKTREWIESIRRLYQGPREDMLRGITKGRKYRQGIPQEMRDALEREPNRLLAMLNVVVRHIKMIDYVVSPHFL